MSTRTRIVGQLGMTMYAGGRLKNQLRKLLPKYGVEFPNSKGIQWVKDCIKALNDAKATGAWMVVIREPRGLRPRVSRYATFCKSNGAGARIAGIAETNERRRVSILHQAAVEREHRNRPARPVAPRTTAGRFARPATPVRGGVQYRVVLNPPRTAQTWRMAARTAETEGEVNN